MPQFEYKVVPAPKKGVKSWGRKSSEDRFASALSKLMNDLGAEGWEYQRSDTLPCEEKSGFRGKTTVFQNMLVFRRESEVAVERQVHGEAELPPEPRLARTSAVASSPEPRLTRVLPEAEAVGAATAAERSEPASETSDKADGAPKLPVFMRTDRDNKSDVAAE